MLNDSITTDETPLDTSHLNMDFKAPTFILRDNEITLQKVRTKLYKLKANKASGPDNISVNVLRNCPNFDVPLQTIFTISIAELGKKVTVIEVTVITITFSSNCNCNRLLFENEESNCNCNRLLLKSNRLLSITFNYFF